MATRQMEITMVRGYANDVNTYGNYLMDSLNRVIGNIEALKSRGIIEGEAADVLSSIAADAFIQAQSYKKNLESFASKIQKNADQVEILDQEASKKMKSESFLYGVEYSKNVNRSASIDPTTGNVKIQNYNRPKVREGE